LVDVRVNGRSPSSSLVTKKGDDLLDHLLFSILEAGTAKANPEK
jgi:hypothetical protein